VEKWQILEQHEKYYKGKHYDTKLGWKNMAGPNGRAYFAGTWV